MVRNMGIAMVSNMEKWRYKVLISQVPLLEHELNVLGQEGWKLVGFSIDREQEGLGQRVYYHYIFTR